MPFAYKLMRLEWHIISYQVDEFGKDIDRPSIVHEICQTHADAVQKFGLYCEYRENQTWHPKLGTVPASFNRDYLYSRIRAVEVMVKLGSLKEVLKEGKAQKDA